MDKPQTVDTLRAMHRDMLAARDVLELEQPEHTTRDQLETIAGRMAEDAARIAGGEYRPPYNGWRNRETWSAALWISNEEADYNQAREIIRAAVAASDYDTRNEDPAADLRYRTRKAADALREWWEEEHAPASAGPLSDAWTYTVAVADWYEIASTYPDELEPPR